MNEPLSQSQLGMQIIIYLLFSSLSYYLGRRFGIWKKKAPPSQGGSVCALLIGVAIVIGSAFVTGSVFTQIYKSQNFNELLKSPLFFSIFQSLYLFLSLILLGILLRFKKLGLWNVSSRFGALKEFGFGALSLIFVLPFVNLVNMIVKFFLGLFGLNVESKQEVLSILENASKTPLACSLMLLSIVVLVPVVEEILFRGLIQGWLKRRLGLKWGLSFSILIFTAAHFSFSHGLGNIEILLTLLVIAFFLTITYENRGTLWASLGLHSSFNALTSIAVIAQLGA